jgi:hypothetical protein
VAPRGAVGLGSLRTPCSDREVGQPLVRDPDLIEATGRLTLRVRGTGQWLPALVVDWLCPRQEKHTMDAMGGSASLVSFQETFSPSSAFYRRG